MPVPEPIEYRIVQNLQAALLAITVAGGYHYDVAALAVKMDANHAVTDLIGDSALRPFYILEVAPDALVYQPSNRVRVEMPVQIHAIHDSDVTVDEDWVKVYYRLCADIEKAIAVDITRGALATDTRVQTREFQTFNGAQVWATVKAEIRVPRLYGAPNG